MRTRKPIRGIKITEKEFIDYDFQAISEDRFELEVTITFKDALYSKILRSTNPLMARNKISKDQLKNATEAPIDPKYYRLINNQFGKTISLIYKEIAEDNIKVLHTTLDNCKVIFKPNKKIIAKFSGAYYDRRF